MSNLYNRSEILQNLRFTLQSFEEILVELEDAKTTNPKYVEELDGLKKDAKKQKKKAEVFLKKITTFTEELDEEISSLWQCFYEIPEEEEI